MLIKRFIHICKMAHCRSDFLGKRPWSFQTNVQEIYWGAISGTTQVRKKTGLGRRSWTHMQVQQRPQPISQGALELRWPFSYPSRSKGPGLCTPTSIGWDRQLTGLRGKLKRDSAVDCHKLMLPAGMDLGGAPQYPLPAHWRLCPQPRPIKLCVPIKHRYLKMYHFASWYNILRSHHFCSTLLTPNLVIRQTKSEKYYTK